VAENRLTLMQAENTSVTAAFDLSYRDLTQEQQQLFCRLGLHPGPDINAYLAASLNDIDVVVARQRLDDLYDQHLLDETRPGRFRFHDLIREHARTLSASDPLVDTQQAIDRLLHYYLYTAATADRLFRETVVPNAIADLYRSTGLHLSTFEDAL